MIRVDLTHWTQHFSGPGVSTGESNFRYRITRDGHIFSESMLEGIFLFHPGE